MGIVTTGHWCKECAAGSPCIREPLPDWYRNIAEAADKCREALEAQGVTDDIAAIAERHRAAWDMVSDLCSGKQRWTMRVPAEEDRDSDLVIGNSLRDIPTLLAALDAERALADGLAAALGGLEHPVYEDDPCFSACRPPTHMRECVAARVALADHEEARK